MLAADRGWGKPPARILTVCPGGVGHAHTGVRAGHATAFFPSGRCSVIVDSPSDDRCEQEEPVPVPATLRAEG